jgi:hypothetical protein
MNLLAVVLGLTRIVRWLLLSRLQEMETTDVGPGRMPRMVRCQQ